MTNEWTSFKADLLSLSQAYTAHALIHYTLSPTTHYHYHSLHQHHSQHIQQHINTPNTITHRTHSDTLNISRTKHTPLTCFPLGYYTHFTNTPIAQHTHTTPHTAPLHNTLVPFFSHRHVSQLAIKTPGKPTYETKLNTAQHIQYSRNPVQIKLYKVGILLHWGTVAGKRMELFQSLSTGSILIFVI